jgi:hypothetical protein
VLVLLSAPTAATAQSQCDPALDQNSTRLSGYQDRAIRDAPRSAAASDRCEGIYKQKVAAVFGVQLVGLAAASSSIGDLCIPGQAVHFIWPRPVEGGTGAVHLQVESLRRDLVYRLDTNRPIGSSSYQWPPAPRCNDDVRLSASDVGALARASFSRGATPVDLLLPVAITTDPKARAAPPYRFVIVPGRRVKEAHVSLWHYRNEQNPARVFFERPLQRQAYFAGGQIIVELSAADVKDVGLYRVTLSVEFESGTLETRNYHFLHAP